MRLKIRNESFNGYTTKVWIDGEPAVDVTELTLNMHPAKPITATITRLVEDLDIETDVLLVPPGPISSDELIEKLRHIAYEVVDPPHRPWWRRRHSAAPV